MASTSTRSLVEAALAKAKATGEPVGIQVPDRGYFYPVRPEDGERDIARHIQTINDMRR